MTPREQLIEATEWWLRGSTRGSPPWTVGVDISQEGGGLTLAVVGIRYLGKSKFRKRWTRVSFGCLLAGDEAGQLGIEGCGAYFAKRLRAAYTEYASAPIVGFNKFYKKRRTRSMAGK